MLNHNVIWLVEKLKSSTRNVNNLLRNFENMLKDGCKLTEDNFLSDKEYLIEYYERISSNHHPHISNLLSFYLQNLICTSISNNLH